MKIDQLKCEGCFRCDEVCPNNAIEYKLNKDDDVLGLFINDNCKLCGDCMRACPADAISNS